MTEHLDPSTNLKKRWCNQRELGRSLVWGKDTKPALIAAILRENGLLDFKKQPTPMALELGLVRRVEVVNATIGRHVQGYTWPVRQEWKRKETLEYLASRGVKLLSNLEQRSNLICDQLMKACSVLSRSLTESENVTLGRWDKNRFREHLKAVEKEGSDLFELLGTVETLLTIRMRERWGRKGEAMAQKVLLQLDISAPLRAYKLNKDLPSTQPITPRKPRF